jgi:hypothetical protein
MTIGLDTVQTVVRLAYDEKLTVAAIARVLGVQRAVVRHVLVMTAKQVARQRYRREGTDRVQVGEVLR